MFWGDGPSTHGAESRLWALIDGLAARPSSDAQAITAAAVGTLSAGCAASVPIWLPRPVVLFDLGDAFWSHPFAVLHLPLRAASGVGLADPLPPGAEEGALASA